MMKISRRAALAFVAGGVASTGIAYAAVSSFSDEDLVLITLEKYLGKLNMRVEHLQQFVLEFQNRNPWISPSGNLGDAVTLLETARLGQARQLLPREKRRYLSAFRPRPAGRIPYADRLCLAQLAERPDPLHRLAVMHQSIRQSGAAKGRVRPKARRRRRRPE